MPLDRVASGERDVVATLHHARATAFAEQTFDSNGDRKTGIGLLGVQRSEQPCSARAENENVSLESFHFKPPLNADERG
jgi:hypothetical protein